jgi:hypothetical protein
MCSCGGDSYYKRANTFDSFLHCIFYCQFRELPSLLLAHGRGVKRVVFTLLLLCVEALQLVFFKRTRG